MPTYGSFTYGSERYGSPAADSPVFVFQLFERACWPIRGVDGDTADYLVDLGERNYAVRRFRMMGSKVAIDTPELTASDPAVRGLAKKAQQYLLDWHRAHLACNTAKLSWPFVTPDLTVLASRSRSTVEVPFFISRSEKSDAFGRWLDAVYCQQGHNLGDDLMAAGLAAVWKG